MRRINGLESTSSSRVSRLKSFLVTHKTKIAILLLVAVFLFGFSKTRADKNTDQTGMVGTPITINRSMDLRAKNADGDTLVQTVNVAVTSAQLQERVLVRGNWIKAREGKLFLILNLDIKNDINATLYAVSQDWVRLIEHDDKKKAPTAHQGMVEIRPLSTKETNVGFIVDEGQKQFLLEIGSTDGIGELIEIKF